PVVRRLRARAHDLDSRDSLRGRPVENRDRLYSLGLGPSRQQLDEPFRREVRPDRSPHVRRVDEHEHAGEANRVKGTGTWVPVPTTGPNSARRPGAGAQAYRWTGPASPGTAG